MWMPMWWWLIPLIIFLVMRRRRRRWPHRLEREVEGESVGELRRTVEAQRGIIEELEGRLGRVEEGLEFAERLLGERTARLSP